MSIVASFLTAAEAMRYIETAGLKNAMVERDLFSGKYNVLDLEGGS